MIDERVSKDATRYLAVLSPEDRTHVFSIERDVHLHVPQSGGYPLGTYNSEYSREHATSLA